MPVGGQREGSVNSDHLDGEEEGAPHSTTDGSLEEEDREGEQGGAHEDLEDGYSVEYSRVTVLLAVDTEECTVIKGGGRGVATAQDGGGYVIDCGMFSAQIARAVKCGSARVLVAGVSAEDAGLPEVPNQSYLLVEFLEDSAEAEDASSALGGVLLCGT